MKMVGFFTAVVPTLAERFRCYAIIRNPVAIRASSLSIKSPRTKRKNPPALARYDTEIDRQLKEGRERNVDTVGMWLLRTQYMFDRYQKSLPPENIIRYEDIVATKGRALEVIVPAAGELDEPLESKNLNSLYERDKILRYGEKLLKSEGAYWNFYSRKSVEEILTGLT